MKKLATVKITVPNSPDYRQVMTMIGIMIMGMRLQGSHEPPTTKKMFIMLDANNQKCAFEDGMFEILHMYVTDAEFEEEIRSAWKDFESFKSPPHTSPHAEEPRDDMEDAEWWKRGEKPFGDAT